MDLRRVGEKKRTLEVSLGRTNGHPSLRRDSGRDVHDKYVLDCFDTYVKLFFLAVPTAIFSAWCW